MSEIIPTLKNVLSDSFRLVKRTATNVAGATRYKLNEWDGMSRQREAIGELGEKAYSLFQAGVEMPEELMPLLSELRTLEENLDALRNDHKAQKATDAERYAEENAQRKEQRQAERAVRAEKRAEQKAVRDEARATAAAAREEARQREAAAREVAARETAAADTPHEAAPDLDFSASMEAIEAELASISAMQPAQEKQAEQEETDPILI